MHGVLDFFICFVRFVEVLNEHMKPTWLAMSVSDDVINHLLALLAKEVKVSGSKLQYKHYIGEYKNIASYIILVLFLVL